MIEDERAAAVAAADQLNREMLERVKRSGISVRPAYVDKISRPRAFNNGRKQTI